MLSQSSKYLWASTRLKVNSTGPGSSFISCFLLADDGHVVKKMFTMPTSTDAGAPLAITPASWSDEYAAVSYYPGGSIEILKLEGRKETADGVEFETAKAVVKARLAEAGCCANTIWYS
jgi:carboxy-cis,cis-muconate cyclase